MFVFTFMLKGGLNHIVFLCLFWFVLLFGFGLYCNLYLYPLFSSASWYGFAVLLNCVSSNANVFRRWLILSGRFFMIAGGWLLCL